ncbi:MAG: YchJ family metal-binding protein [Anaeromyxobacteraceae bacterium]
MLPISSNDPCPCGGGSYESCCGPRHRGTRPAETAEALMRSRYSAFALGLAGYLESTHDAPATEEGRRELEVAARSVTWLGLTVHRVERGGPEDDEGVVEFTARSLDGRHAVELHERSSFRRKDGRWLYVDGECRVTRRASASDGSTTP